MPTTKRRIAVNLSESEYCELTGLAEKHEVSLAWLGRQAILDFVDRYRGGEQLDLPLRVSAQRRPVLTGVNKAAGGSAL